MIHSACLDGSISVTSFCATRYQISHSEKFDDHVIFVAFLSAGYGDFKSPVCECREQPTELKSSVILRPKRLRCRQLNTQSGQLNRCFQKLSPAANISPLAECGPHHPQQFRPPEPARIRV